MCPVDEAKPAVQGGLPDGQGLGVVGEAYQACSRSMLGNSTMTRRVLAGQLPSATTGAVPRTR